MKSKLIKELKMKSIIPFYIDDVNDKFFTSLHNHPSKNFVNKILPKIKKNLSEDELEKFTEIENLTNDEKIMLMLNLTLKKITGKTGSVVSELFKVKESKNIHETIFISETENYSNFESQEYEYDKKRYNFSIEISPDSYLHKYIEEINLAFYLDYENKTLSGGFSTSSHNYNHSDSIESSIENIYLQSLIRYFNIKQFYPMTLENILEVFHENENEKGIPKSKKDSKKSSLHKTVTRQNLNFKNIQLSEIHQNWKDFINRKYLNFRTTSHENREFFEEQLFYSMLISSMIILSLYEELKKYFTNENPEIILRLLDDPLNIKDNESQTAEMDLFELAAYLKSAYFSDHKKYRKSLKKIKTAEDFFETLNEHNYHETFAIGKPILSCEVLREDETSYVSEISLLSNDYELRTMYMLIIHPELFGMNENAGNFIEFQQLLDITKKSNTKKDLTSSLVKKIQSSLCEINYNYFSFMSDEHAIFLVKENTFLFEESSKKEKLTNLFLNYFWAEIFAQSRNLVRIETEYNFENPNTKKDKIYFQHVLKLLESLKFGSYDDFYGLPQIKTIVAKIDFLNEIQLSVNELINKIKVSEEIFKKDQERKNLISAYVASLLISMVNFFSMVFTILTVVDASAGLTPINVTIITIASVIVSGLLFTLSIFFFRTFKKRAIRKIKNK